jgi:tetratricopeptide (TPR) repeat protein
MPNRSLCFVLMPFGEKPDATGRIVDFDAVYRDLIAPAVDEAGLDVVRADEEMTGGIIHKPMFERLVLCEYAVADLTTANANVFYELGVRHAVRPWSTVPIFAEGGRLPFDVAPLSAIPYRLTPDGKVEDLPTAKGALVSRLAAARRAASDVPLKDSPLYQLLEDYPDVAHSKTDVFRDRVRYSEEIKTRVAAARRLGLEALEGVEQSLGPLADTDSAVVIDLFLSYRAMKAWQAMVDLAGRMPRPLAATVMVQEQLGLALNRLGQGEEAEAVLKNLVQKRGPSSESYGILGRIYKDRWETTAKSGDTVKAAGLLDQAVETYLQGFEADFRDAYPGVNAVTLMELKQPPDPRRFKLVPIVVYAVERRIAAGKPDYWDYATLLELALLAKDQAAAQDAAGKALARMRETWEGETTARNLRLIREAREKRNESLPWTKPFEQALDPAAGNA